MKYEQETLAAFSALKVLGCYMQGNHTTVITNRIPGYCANTQDGTPIGVNICSVSTAIGHTNLANAM